MPTIAYCQLHKMFFTWIILSIQHPTANGSVYATRTHVICLYIVCVFSLSIHPFFSCVYLCLPLSPCVRVRVHSKIRTMFLMSICADCVQFSSFHVSRFVRIAYNRVRSPFLTLSSFVLLWNLWLFLFQNLHIVLYEFSLFIWRNHFHTEYRLPSRIVVMIQCCRQSSVRSVRAPSTVRHTVERRRTTS